MTNYTLYILMRSDMVSLNAGKAMAQAAHAANQMQSDIGWSSRNESVDELDIAYLDWRENRDFGTTIVLDVGSHANMKMYEMIINYNAKDVKSIGIVLDPTYPVRDGEVTHLVPVETCMFAFLSDNDKHLMKDLPLYR